MLKNYLKLALKVLLRRKFFTFISLFGITITLLVLVVVGAIFDGVLGPVSPETRHDRTLTVMRVRMTGELGNGRTTRTGQAGYRLLERTVQGLPGAEVTSISTMPSGVTTTTPSGRITSYFRLADAQFWRILDFEFVEGGPYTDADDQNANPVAVINESTRDRYFGPGPAVGKRIDIGGDNYRVVGVVKNVPFYRQVAFSDIWAPVGVDPLAKASTELTGNYMGLVLAPSVEDVPALKSEYNARLAGVTVEPPFERIQAPLHTSSEAMAHLFFDIQSDGGLATVLRTMSIFALLFMLLPTLNLVNINISRILERASEIGVRKAFGASSATLIGQFVIENVILTLIGGLLATGLAFAALEILNGSGLLPYANFQVNWRVFLVALVATLIFGVVSGVYPAWRMSRLNPVEALKGGTR